MNFFIFLGIFNFIVILCCGDNTDASTQVGQRVKRHYYDYGWHPYARYPTTATTATTTRPTTTTTTTTTTRPPYRQHYHHGYPRHPHWRPQWWR
ncbi:hypothetical protein CHUAL_008340 [Chamberlinius hualienensis]